MIDRLGSRKVIFFDGLLLLLGLGRLAMATELWQVYLTLGLFVGAGVSMTHFLETQVTARKWFVRKAGRVGGILTSAFWLGSALLTPLLTAFSGSVGMAYNVSPLFRFWYPDHDSGDARHQGMAERISNRKVQFC